MEVLDSGAMHDQVFNDDVTLQWLRQGNRVKEIEGGERIRVGLMHEKNTTAGWYSDYQQYDVTPMEGFTTAFYTWKQGDVSISVSGKELRSNKGAAKLVSLQQEKTNQASGSLVDLLATGIFSDGTGSSSKQLTGLAAMIETTPGTTSYASVATGNTAWRNQVQTSVGAAAVNLVPKMRTLWNNCRQGKGGANGSPDFIVTTQTVYEALEALLFPSVRYESNPKSGADAGISTMKFKGATVEWDAYCDSGMLYMLNSKHIFLFIHPDANFKMSQGGFQKPINQDALVAQILFQGNLCTNNRRKLGKLQGIT
jgi:hypothetical protein